MPLPSPDEALAMISADVEAYYDLAERLSPGRVLGIALARPYHSAPG